MMRKVGTQTGVGEAKPRSHAASIRFGIFGSLALLTAYIGCSSNNPTQAAGTGGSGAVVTGVGAGSSCQSGVPDGYCIAEGPSAEDCTCEDCEVRAICNDGCNDDGNCAYDQDDPSASTEDCTCGDCFNKVRRCASNDDSCDDEPGCQTGEACTCPDCNNDDFCQNNCVNNGQCVRALEGCGCADCANDEFCSGGAGPGPGAGAGGMGGGGPAGAGGMGAGGAPAGAGGNVGNGGMANAGGAGGN